MVHPWFLNIKTKLVISKRNVYPVSCERESILKSLIAILQLKILIMNKKFRIVLRSNSSMNIY